MGEPEGRMSESSKKRWIVLLNKAPKGPLSTEEVRALIDQKVLRHNDVAYELPSDADLKTPTEWKLLWQFPEFERRRDPTLTEDSIWTEDRRKEETTRAVKTKALTDIPVDLMAIAPEDLIPKSSSVFPASPDTGVSSEVPLPVSSEAGDWAAFSSPQTRWMFGAFAGAFFLAAWWMWGGSPTSKPGYTPTAQPETATADPVATPKPVTRRAPAQVPIAPAPRRNAVEELPPADMDGAEADRGEIAEEESFSEEMDIESSDEGGMTKTARPGVDLPSESRGMGMRPARANRKARPPASDPGEADELDPEESWAPREPVGESDAEAEEE